MIAENFMNPPQDHKGIAFVKADKKNQLWVHCPWCGKKAFPIDGDTTIRKLMFKCKGSNCKHTFEVNVA